MTCFTDVHPKFANYFNTTSTILVLSPRSFRGQAVCSSSSPNIACLQLTFTSGLESRNGSVLKLQYHVTICTTHKLFILSSGVSFSINQLSRLDSDPLHKKIWNSSLVDQVGLYDQEKSFQLHFYPMRSSKKAKRRILNDLVKHDTSICSDLNATCLVHCESIASFIAIRQRDLEPLEQSPLISFMPM